MCEPSCGTCRFFEADYLMNRENSEGDEKEGFCKRFPPSLALPDSIAVEWDNYRREQVEWCPRAINSFQHWTQPCTLESDWCGEYQDRIEDTP